ncbi:MAG: WbqC family protein [Bacteroidales bacterium]
MSDHVLLSTAYFPPISWIAAAFQATTTTIEIHETYVKQTYRNRCNILGPNGFQILSIPVTKPYGHHSKTFEIEVSSHYDWKRQHMRSIQTAYNSSPFYLFYKERIEKVLYEPHDLLSELNNALLNLISELLGFDLKTSFTDTYYHNPDSYTDLRDKISPGKLSHSEDHFPVYTQVFSHKYPFHPDLSILDLLFNEGPASLEYIMKLGNN